MKTGAIFCICILFSINLNAQVLLHDDFGGNSIDANLWESVLPFGQSQLTEAGGLLTTTGRGTLATAAGFNFPKTISGTVIMNNANEHFETELRTDLSINLNPLGAYHELTGVSVEFAPDGTYGGLSIQQFTPSDVTVLATGNYSFSIGQAYDFTITDTGSSISLSIDGVPQIFTTTSYSTGDKIAFYSREFSSTSSSLDEVTITAIPEPNSCALLLSGMGLFTAIKCKRRMKFKTTNEK